MRMPQFTPRRLAAWGLAAILIAGACLAATTPRPTTVSTCLPDRSAIPAGMGVNLQLDGLPAAGIVQQLDQVRADGFSWIREKLSWALIEPSRGQFDWSLWDSLVDAANQRGLRIIAVLEDAPAWAKSLKDQDFPGAPPYDLADFTSFANTVAARYEGRIAAYQIWDGPNLGTGWGSDLVNPAAYTALLSAGYAGIKSADPSAWVLAGGLAPTTEVSPQNLDDLDFLEGMYAAGAAPYFDALAIKPYGFWYEPGAPADAGRTDFARASLYYDIMCSHGDGAKGLWAVEFGWAALPTDWKGQPSPWGTESVAEQEAHAVQAVQTARNEWPWMGPMLWAGYLPQASADDPVWGFALSGTELAQALGGMSGLMYVGPGHYDATPNAADWVGDWRFSPLGADIGKTEDTANITFSGTRIDLDIRPGDYRGTLYATVDGGPAGDLPRDASGRSYVILYDPEKQQRSVTVAHGLQDGPHTLHLEAEGGWGQWALAGWDVFREGPPGIPLGIVVGGSLLLLIGVALSAFWWGPPFYRLLMQIRDVAPAWAILAAIALGAGFFLYPNVSWLPILGLSILGSCALVRIDAILAAIAASLPFYLLYGTLLGREGSITLALLVAAVLGAVADKYLAWIASAKLHGAPIDFGRLKETLKVRLLGWLREMSIMDFAMVALVLVGALSLSASSLLSVSVREWVQVILAAVIFYALVRSRPRSRAVWLLVDGLSIGATAIAVLVIVQFASGQNVITAEGVYRARGLYGSPNNLALFLGRTFPIALCLAAFGNRSRRIYAGAAIFQLAALLLTFSRGAIFIGLPAVLIFIGLVWRGKVLWTTLAGIAAIVLGSIPLTGTQRFASAVQTTEGTTFVRISLWRSTLQMIRDHPLRGIGLDNFLYLYRSKYVLPEAWMERNLSHPHNILLDWWTRLGILGVGVLVWLLVAFFGDALHAYRRISDAGLRALVLGLAASMVDFLVHGLVDASFFLTDLALVFALTVAIMDLAARERFA